jgi:transmembrane sensor
MSKEAFFNLLRKYLEGQCTVEEKRIVEQWYSMLDGDELPALQVAELEEIGKKLWDRVDHATPVPEAPVRKMAPARILWAAVAVAASFIGFVIVYTVLMYNQPSQRVPEFIAADNTVAIIERSNYGNKPLIIHLHDSSTVTLKPGAKLRYPVTFADNRREVMIDGEGFFEVTKNPKRPFFVFSQQLVTQVVGTSFIVKAHEQTAQNEVTVVTGKVLVTHHADDDNLYQRIVKGSTREVVELTPNYKAVYHEGTKSLSVTIADEPVLIRQEGGRTAADFVFNGAALTDVLAAIEAAYGISIRAGADFDKCTFTGDLSGQNLREQLELICQAIGAAYTVNGTEISVKGGNCN